MAHLSVVLVTLNDDYNMVKVLLTVEKLTERIYCSPPAMIVGFVKSCLSCFCSAILSTDAAASRPGVVAFAVERRRRKYW